MRFPAGVLNTDSRNNVPLMSFDILVCLFSQLLLPPTYGGLAYTGCCWKETGFSDRIPYSWSSQALTHCFPFPLQERLPLAISALYSSWDRGSTGKVPLFLSIVSLSIYNLLQLRVLEYLIGNLNFYKVSYPWVSTQVSILQIFQP